MQLNIFVPKANYTFSAEVESLPTESLEYVIKYGATQAVVDTTAGIKRSDFTTDEEFHEAALSRPRSAGIKSPAGTCRAVASPIRRRPSVGSS